MTAAESIADHSARIGILEAARGPDRDERVRLEGKVDKLLYWIMGTLATAALALLVQISHH